MAVPLGVLRLPPRPGSPPPPAVTTRLTVIDPDLLALARGDAPASEAADPFGGLIPVYDEPDHDLLSLDELDDPASDPDRYR